MSIEQDSGKWIPCPICEGRTRTKVYADTVLLNFPLYCPKCKKETRIDVVQLKMSLSKEPDA
ncbi:MAG: cysteine-rich KTR domain-containing protein [Oscillospiraceae bacterium]|nr:cysteine-rich KTR domain-containing protein [Oscillospiraceae bacterium]